MKVRFYLQSNAGASRCTVLAAVSWNGERLRFATGLTVESVHWNTDKQRLRKSFPNATIYNRQLDEMVARALYLLTQTPVLSRDELRSALLGTSENGTNQTPSAPALTIFDLYDRYKKDNETILAPATLSVHESVINHLRKFTAARDIGATLGEITLPWYSDFVRYLLTGAGLTNVTAAKIMRHFRRAVHWGEDAGWPVHLDYKKAKPRMIPRGERSDKVYLSADEVQRIANLDLTENERLRRVRDLLLFQCWTGLRYADVQSLQPDHVATEDEETTLSLVTGKNRKAVKVPLLPSAVEIWNRYNGQLPKISNQKQNDYIKELCVAAGIDTPCITVTYRGANRIEQTVPKWKLIGTHTAKRTFVTLLLLRGVSLKSIMKITGNTLATIQAYMVTDYEDAARDIRRAVV